jgi:glycosyltransferase involved in cell wall biosynthesis
MPKVSIIMPTYNCGPYLYDSVPAVLDQSYGDLELVIVDNGSGDETEAIAGRFAEDSRVTYLRQETRNVSAARNVGIKKAKGDFVAFCDADDIFCRDKLFKQVRRMERCPRYAASYTNEFYFRKGTPREILSSYYHFSGDIFYFLKRNNFIHTSTVMMHRGIFDEELFDETLTGHEDWELFLRLSKKGVLFLYIDEPLTRVRLRDESASRDAILMDTTRVGVGQRAKRYWREFKETRGSFPRYMAFKMRAARMGFPDEGRFNRPIPQELL